MIELDVVIEAEGVIERDVVVAVAEEEFERDVVVAVAEEEFEHDVVLVDVVFSRAYVVFFVVYIDACVS